MEPLSYLHLQMKLEGLAVDGGCRIRQVEQVPGEELPLILLARFANQECVRYYDEAIRPDLQKELSHTDFEFPEIEPLLQVLRSKHVQFETGHYKTYVFPSLPVPDPEVLCLSKHDPRVKAFGFDGFAEQIYAIEREGALVCACVSTRENGMCGEVWVFTQPEYRKQGLAQNVVNTWAASLLAAGKVPFYSHNIENDASANLARKLGLLPVYEEITITPT